MPIIKHKDLNVALFDSDLSLVKVLHQDLLPLHFQYGRNLKSWVESRAIDSSRVSSRLLKKALKMRRKDDYATAMQVCARTLTDNFWLCPDNENIKFKNLQFKSDSYSELTLHLNINVMDVAHDTFTPELTNTGSYEKGWKCIDDTWYMYKNGRKEEIFSEIFTYKLGQALGFNMAAYKCVDGKSVSKDFTSGGKVNFQPMYGIVGEDEAYTYNFQMLSELDISTLNDYVNMIYLDTIVKNVDRHTKNYGLLTDVESGKIISLAPNFDNNLSLIATGYPINTDRKNDFLVKLLLDFLSEEGIIYIPPILTKEVVGELARECAQEVGLQVNIEKIIAMCVAVDNQLEMMCKIRYSVISDKVHLKYMHIYKVLDINELEEWTITKLCKGERLSVSLASKLIAVLE